MDAGELLGGQKQAESKLVDDYAKRVEVCIS
jgi:hypothetical protein